MSFKQVSFESGLEMRKSIAEVRREKVPEFSGGSGGNAGGTRARSGGSEGGVGRGQKVKGELG